MVYRSKIDLWLACLLIGSCILMIYSWVQVLFSESIVLIIFITIITLLVLFMIIGILVDTYYVLEESGIRIKSFIFCNLFIPYQNILSIKSTYNPLSSPALSVDRLEIKYRRSNGRSDVVIISPKNKEQFKLELKNKTTVAEVI